MLPRPASDVIFKPVSDGAVLLDTREEVYFGLNQVGAKIWELLPPRSRTWDELIGALQVTYPEVEESTLREDVVDLLRELEENGLVVAPGRGSDGAAPKAGAP